MFTFVATTTTHQGSLEFAVRSEELAHEWKEALENAIALADSAGMRRGSQLDGQTCVCPELPTFQKFSR